MRFRNNHSEVTNHPGVEIPLSPTIIFAPTNGEKYSLNTRVGQWLNNKETSTELGFKRYQDDSYLVSFSLPSRVGSTLEQKVNLQFTIQDLAGMSIDANPESVVDWLDGGWSNYEGSDGQLGDIGGVDKTIFIQLAATKPVEVITVEANPTPSNGGSANYLLLLMLSNLLFFKFRY